MTQKAGGKIERFTPENNHPRQLKKLPHSTSQVAGQHGDRA